MSVLDERIRELVHTIAESAPNPPALREETIRTRPLSRRLRGPVVAIVSFVVIVGFSIGAGFLFTGRNQTPATNVTPPPSPNIAQSETTTPDSNPPQPTTTGSFVPAGDLQQACDGWCPGVLLEDGRALVVGAGAAELFDPQSGTFTPTGVPGDNFNQGSAVLLEDGRVLLIFGLSERAEIYDPVSGEFSSTAITYPQGQGGTAVALADEDVLILYADGNVAFYDPAADTLTSAGSTPVQLLEDGAVLVSGAGVAGVIDPDGFDYIPVDMITPRIGQTATRLIDGRVLIAGGGNSEEPFGNISEAELFDPETRSFVATGSLNLPRSLHATAVLEDGRVLIVGGTPGSLNPNDPGMTEYDRAEIYDPASATFSLVDSPMSQPRIAPTAITLPDGRVLVLGNYPGNLPSPDTPPSNTSEVFQP